MDAVYSLSTKITCIMAPSATNGGLYLGGFRGAKNEAQIKELGIKAILTVAQGLHVHHNGCIVRSIPLFDIPSQDILPALKSCIGFIEACIDAGVSVLVHCRVGASRSASIVIAYLMHSNAWSFEQAHEFVASRREIEPNEGFVTQLKLWEQTPKL